MPELKIPVDSDEICRLDIKDWAGNDISSYSIDCIIRASSPNTLILFGENKQFHISGFSEIGLNRLKETLGEI